MVDFLMTMLFLFIIYAISFAISIPITKNRLLWAKKMVIGKDSEERKEKLRNIARDIILEHKIPNEMDGVEVTINKEKDKITKVRMETEKTILTLMPGGKTNIMDKGFSEIGATSVTAMMIWEIILFLILLCIAISILTIF